MLARGASFHALVNGSEREPAVGQVPVDRRHAEPQDGAPSAAADQRRRTFLRKAFELARSGLLEDERAVKSALLKDYPEAELWLSNPFIRDGLRQVCELARAEAIDVSLRSDA